jgi:hypothetical protein
VARLASVWDFLGRPPLPATDSQLLVYVVTSEDRQSTTWASNSNAPSGPIFRGLKTLAARGRGALTASAGGGWLAQTIGAQS